MVAPGAPARRTRERRRARADRDGELPSRHVRHSSRRLQVDVTRRPEVGNQDRGQGRPEGGRSRPMTLVTTQHTLDRPVGPAELHRHRRPDRRPRGGAHRRRVRRSPGRRSRCSSSPTLWTEPTRRPGRSPSPSTAVPARRRSGCTWACSAPGGWSPATSTIPSRRRTGWPTIPRPSSRTAIWCSSTRCPPASPGPVKGGKPATYHGYQADRDAVGELIRLWTTRNQRWLSPKFLAGESYGTLRAAALAGHLAERHGMALNGLMLISAVLDMGTVFFTPGNDVPYVSYLPTYAALAHYHGDTRTARSPRWWTRPASWRIGTTRGRWPAAPDSPIEQRRDIAERVAAVTGLDVDYVLRADLRLEHQHFFAELRRAEGLAIGRLDGRFTITSGRPQCRHHRRRRVVRRHPGAVHRAANHYLRAELGYESDLPYEILTPKVWPWSYKDFENRSVSVVDDLSTAMRTNPYLKVHVAYGYHDGATPFAASEQVMAHLNVPEAARDNVSGRYYEAGHMMYVHEPSRLAQSQDLADFVAWATGGPHPEPLAGAADAGDARPRAGAPTRSPAPSRSRFGCTVRGESARHPAHHSGHRTRPPGRRSQVHPIAEERQRPVTPRRVHAYQADSGRTLSRRDNSHRPARTEAPPRTHPRRIPVRTVVHAHACPPPGALPAGGKAHPRFGCHDRCAQCGGRRASRYGNPGRPRFPVRPHRRPGAGRHRRLDGHAVLPRRGAVGPGAVTHLRPGRAHRAALGLRRRRARRPRPGASS